MQDSESEILTKVEQKMGKVNNSPWLYFDTENKITVNKNGKYSEGFKIGRWSYTFSSSGEESYINWSVYDKDSLKLNYPTDWKAELKKQSVFYADIPSQTSSYFAILNKGDTVAQTASEYFGFLYSAVANDTSEQLASVAARLLRPKKGSDFYIYEFVLSDEDDRWIALGVIKKHHGSVYDIGFRVKLQTELDVVFAKVIFADIIDTIQIDGEYFMIPSAELEDVKEVTLQ